MLTPRSFKSSAVAKNCVVDLVIAERRFILTKAEASGPGSDINDRTLAGHGS
jgi:hypothetical protein